MPFGGILTGGIIAGVGALAGGAVSAFGASKQADAQQSAAQLQYKLGQEQLAAQQAARDKAVGLAAPSASDLAQQGQLLQTQMSAFENQLNQLSADRALLDSVDPAIKAAGKNALDLLNGKSSALLNPVLDQRTRQRSALEQTLADRLGPDYATTSAGASALRSFDQDTQVTTAQIQNQALGQVLPTAQFGAQLGRSDIQSGFNLLGNLSNVGIQAAQADINRGVSAFTGNPITGYNAQLESAGNLGIGGVIQGQNLGNIGSSVAGVAGQIGTASMYSNLFSQQNKSPQPQTLGDTFGPTGPYTAPDPGSSFSAYNPQNYSLGVQ